MRNQRVTFYESYLQKRSAQIAIIGYAGVSTHNQNLTGQLEALKGLPREDQRRPRADRPQLAKLMASLQGGDGPGHQARQARPWRGHQDGVLNHLLPVGDRKSVV